MGHMGGTHWYHPHVHGASCMHISGGAAGMFIVDDPPGSLPPSVADLPERHATIVDFRPAALGSLNAAALLGCQDSVGNATLGNANTTDADCYDPFWSAEAVANVTANQSFI